MKKMSQCKQMDPLLNDDLPHSVEKLSDKPRIFRVVEFLSSDECSELITTAHPLISRSKVVGGHSFDRTSSSCHLHKSTCTVLVRKVLRLLKNSSTTHMELPQVARYLVNEKYNAHYDSPEPIHTAFHQNGGARSVTILCYLNDVEQGGETEFCNLNLRIKPRRGDAIVFFPTHADGSIDHDTLHAALPMSHPNSVKWVAQVWMRHGEHTEGLPSEAEFYAASKRVAQLKHLRGLL